MKSWDREPCRGSIFGSFHGGGSGFSGLRAQVSFKGSCKVSVKGSFKVSVKGSFKGSFKVSFKVLIIGHVQGMFPC